ncbi:MAG: kelch repeat-containing protein, partial [bacterium]
MLTTGSKIYVVGGTQDGFARTNLQHILVYDPTADSWTQMASSIPSSTHSDSVQGEGVGAARIDGTINLMGGQNGMGHVNHRLYSYDIANDTWDGSHPDMPAPVAFAAVAAVAAKVYVIGGGTPITPTNKVQVFDPATDTWSLGASAPGPRRAAAGVVLGDRIYVLGGHDSAMTYDTVLVYDPSSNAWSTQSHFLKARLAFGAAAMDAAIYLFGGTDTSPPNAPFSSTERGGGLDCQARSSGYAQNGSQPIGPGGVNTLSGNVAFTVQDVSLPFAGLSINLLRTYNSQRAASASVYFADGTASAGAAGGVSGTPFFSALGPGWTHSYQVAVRPQFDAASGATLYVEERGDGRQLGFSKAPSGTVTNPAGIAEVFANIPAVSALNPTISGQGVRLRKKTGLTRDFAPEGNLLRIRDPDGTRLD